MPEPISCKSKPLAPSKVEQEALFEEKTVLTLDPFNYVDLWLRREHEHEALFYWRQAREFHRAARGLPMEAAPLVLYYCFMNAAKALLTVRKEPFSPYHGVVYHRMRGSTSKIVLSNEGIKIKQGGVVPGLIQYFGESETSMTHSLEDLLYNLVFIHRTYCLSYPNKRERFLPLKNVQFLREPATGDVWFSAEAVSDVDSKHFLRNLPHEVVRDPSGSNTVRSAGTISWASSNKPTHSEMADLRLLNQDLRRVLHYVNGPNTLWYLKTAGNYEIDRRPITLTLAAMHRLSEICRYKPSDLQSFLNGQKNWLLSEFVSMAPSQFIDEVACEITGSQIMIPNVRTPS